MMKLINKSTGQPVKIGDNVITFRGEKGILISYSEPHKPSSSGKVYVNTGKHFENQWYPGVIDCEFIAD